MNSHTIIHYKERHEQVLNTLVHEASIPANRIKDAINYVLFPGGKRLRPILVYLCGELLNVPLESLDIIAAAIELTHCYSLVHDDLPAMDNDDFRRGKPSCHRAFDEATAILVGDGLQALAIEILLKHLPKYQSSTEVINIVYELVKATGPTGMVSGQSLDLSELKNISIKESTLNEIHNLKTGKLIEASINMVINATNVSLELANSLQKFAYHFGILFQMQDDYLDKYDTHNLLGKGRASDAANLKQTFASLYTQSELKDLIETHIAEANIGLKPFAKDADELKQILFSLQKRLLV